MRVQTETITTHRITVRQEEPLGAWATLSWDDRGVVTLHSDHGSWVHQWNPRHIGPGTMAGFLAKIDSSYAGGKFLAGGHHVADVEASVRAARELIIELRRGEDLDADEAREEWDGLRGLYHESDLMLWYSTSHLPEPWECGRSMVNPQWASLWERLWEPGIRPALKAIDKAEVSGGE